MMLILVLRIPNNEKVLYLKCAYIKSKLWYDLNMSKGFAKEIPVRVKGYVRENWGAPFIVGFMLLLMVAAASLSVGLAVLANEVAVYAYYALVIGVAGQLVCYLKFNKRNGEKNNEPS